MNVSVRHELVRGLAFGLLVTLAAGCAATPEPPAGESTAADSARDTPGSQGRLDWALALHGGAGVMSKERFAGTEGEYLAALEAALRLGADMLERGESSLDVVEQVVRLLEDDERFNAGRGAVFNAAGGHELDAAIMHGRDLACGAVAAVGNVRNPVSLARLVMERTEHVLLMGEGAEAFAAEAGVELVPQEYFDTERRRLELERALERRRGAEGASLSTVGAVALDRLGDLAAATSTGGRTAKRFGRVGDVPVVGAGTYADNRSCAVSGTGRGEEFIRHTVAGSISARMLLAGEGLPQAARSVIHDTLSEGDGGVVAVAADGTIALEFNTGGMFRGAADSSGRFETAIW
jgi:beta-aspartyl-peptidase (threonine type)